MQIMPQQIIPDASGVEGLNVTPGADKAERNSLFAKVLGAQDGLGDDTPVADFLAKDPSTGARVLFGMAQNAAKKGSKALKNVVGMADPKMEEAREALRLATNMGAPKSVNPQSLKMTLGDLDSLRDQLLENGLSEADLSDLQEKLSSRSGLTWGSFVHFLSSKTGVVPKTLEFSPEQKQNLTSFFQKVGFNSQEAQDLVSGLSQRRYGDVFQVMHHRLQALSEEGFTGFDKTEFTTFVRSLGLSGDAASKLDALFQNQDRVTMEGAKMALAVIKKDLLAHKGEFRQEAAELAAEIGQAIKKAAEREGDRLMAGKRGDESQEKLIRSKAGIEGEFAKTSADKEEKGSAKSSVATSNLVEPEGNDKDDKVAKPQAGLAERLSKGASETAAATAAKGQEASAKSPKAEARAENLADRLGQDRHFAQNRDHIGDHLASGDDTGAGDRNSAQDKSWKDFLGRLRFEEPAVGRYIRNVAEGTEKAAEAASPNATTKHADAPAPGVRSDFSRSVFDQVKDGVLKNLSQGRKQLSLQLKPEHLGTLNVVLTMRGKEIEAMIRTDNHESTRLVAEQLEAIRHSLQEQGLKVSKLDVQTQLSDNQFSQAAWDGPENHNMAQEQEAMNMLRRRWRLLKEGGESLAQEMQNMTEREILSQHGLHIIT